MRHPLVMVGGLLQSSAGTKVTIPIFNLGPSTPVTITSQSITINATIHNIVSGGGLQIIRDIYGGEDGDLLLLTAIGNVWIGGGGNINSGLQRVKDDQITSLVLINEFWTPW